MAKESDEKQGFLAHLYFTSEINKLFLLSFVILICETWQ